MRANYQVPHYTVSCYFLLDPKNISGVLFSETLCSSLTRRESFTYIRNTRQNYKICTEW